MNINMTLLGQSIAMAVFVWFCMKLVWPPLINALETRRKNIADGIAAAEEANKKLADAKGEADQLVEEARKQAGEIVEQANRRASQIMETAKADAGQERERQVAAAQTDIEQEFNRAKEQLSSKVAALAVAGAEQLLQRELDTDTHRDLLDKLAAEI